MKYIILKNILLKFEKEGDIINFSCLLSKHESLKIERSILL